MRSFLTTAELREQARTAWVIHLHVKTWEPAVLDIDLDDRTPWDDSLREIYRTCEEGQVRTGPRWEIQ